MKDYIIPQAVPVVVNTGKIQMLSTSSYFQVRNEMGHADDFGAKPGFSDKPVDEVSIWDEEVE